MNQEHKNRESQKRCMEQILKNYNKKIEKLIKERKDFINEAMDLFAEFQIGEEVVHVKHHWPKTKVREHYNYGKNDDFDVHCRFENGDNTSCYGPINPYVRKSDYENETEEYIYKLKYS